MRIAEKKGSARTSEVVDRIRKFLDGKYCESIKTKRAQFGVGASTVYRITDKGLNMYKKLSLTLIRWCSVLNKWDNTKGDSREIVEIITFITRVYMSLVTDDENWMFYYEAKAESQSAQWKNSDYPTPKNASQRIPSKRKNARKECPRMPGKEFQARITKDTRQIMPGKECQESMPNNSMQEGPRIPRRRSQSKERTPGKNAQECKVKERMSSTEKYVMIHDSIEKQSCTRLPYVKQTKQSNCGGPEGIQGEISSQKSRALSP